MFLTTPLACNACVDTVLRVHGRLGSRHRAAVYGVEQEKTGTGCHGFFRQLKKSMLRSSFGCRLTDCVPSLTWRLEFGRDVCL